MEDRAVDVRLLTRPGGVATGLDSSSRTYVINSAISQVTKDLLNRINVLTRGYATEANTQAIVSALTTEVDIEVLQKRAEVFSRSSASCRCAGAAPLGAAA